MGAHMSAGSTVSEGDETTVEDLLMNLRNALATEKREETDAAEQVNDEADEQLGERGAWDDFKASMKKAGQKVKNTFGKRVSEAEEEEEEEKKEEKEEMEKKEEKEEEEKKEEEVTSRGAWDDFK